MATYRPPPPPKLFDLDVTIVSAKHLKNVNWKKGDLKPYAVFWIDSERQLTTKCDDSGSSRPVWNERFTLPLQQPVHDSAFFLEIFHWKPSEVPKPLVGTLRVLLKDLFDLEDPIRIRKFQLNRPSGRPQGKIQLKLSIKERPLPPPPPQSDFNFAPPPSYYYHAASPRSRGYSQPPFVNFPPPPPSPSPPLSRTASQDAYSSPYFTGYYQSATQPFLSRPFSDRAASGYGGPSAPVDYSPHDNLRQKSGKMGLGAGLAVGAVAGALGGLVLEEGLKYDEQIPERVETDLARDNYSDYQADY